MRSEVKQFGSNNFSTNIVSENKNESRVFQTYRTEKGSQTSRTKAYNMNDSERRIKRNHNALLKQSNQQSALFEKGVKKVEQNSSCKTSREPIKREYRNKQTYDIMRPVSVIENKFNEGGNLFLYEGVRKIYLYDQKKQSNQYRETSNSRKKFIKDFNKQTENKDSSTVYLVKRLAGHKNESAQWHTKITTIEFRKRQNQINEQNSKKEEEKKTRSFKQNTQNAKNRSQVTVKEGGITLGDSKHERIDFKQDYYRKYTRLDQQHSRSGYLSSRIR